MVLENLCVLHKSFGAGTITEVKGKYLTIKFASAQKIFVYPDAFEHFLTLADGTLPEEISNDLEQSRAAKQRIADAKLAENRHAMDHGIVIPGKEIVAETKDDESSQPTAEDI